MRVIKDISYGNYGENKLDLYLPDSDKFSVFIYFHGGGLEHGDKDETTIVGEYLAEKNIALVNANYRMYPTAAYPDFIQDAAQAVAWTKEHIAEYGVCKSFFVGGSSAGAYLSMMLCFDRKFLASFRIDPKEFSGFIHDAGQPTAHFNVLKERGIDSRRVIVDETAPLYHVGNAPDYAPMHFIVSDNDMPARFEQTMLMLATLKHFEYDMTKISHTVIRGEHCEYVKIADENNESIFGRMVYDIINKWEE